MSSSDYLFLFLKTMKEIELKTGTAYGLSVIAKILSGSSSKDILKFQNLEFYQQGNDLTQKWWITFGKNLTKVHNLLEIIPIEIGNGKCVNTYKVGSLGEKFIKDRIPIEITLPEIKVKKDSHPKGQSAQTSCDLFYNQGKPLVEIAEMRGLSRATIFNHIFAQIDPSKIDKSRVVSNQKFEQIKAAWLEVGGDRLKPIKEHLGDNYTYEEIRWSKAFI